MGASGLDLPGLNGHAPGLDVLGVGMWICGSGLEGTRDWWVEPVGGNGSAVVVVAKFNLSINQSVVGSEFNVVHQPVSQSSVSQRFKTASTALLLLLWWWSKSYQSGSNPFENQRGVVLVRHPISLLLPLFSSRPCSRRLVVSHVVVVIWALDFQTACLYK